MSVEVTKNNVPRKCGDGVAAMKTGMRYLAMALEENIALTSPKDEGELADSWYWTRAGDFEYLVSSDADHAYWVWKGTGEYVGNGPIKPKRAQALRFEWKGKMTVWKGDWEPKTDKRGREMSVSQQMFLFARWAEERGMVPYFSWPRGIKGTPYVEQAIEMTQREVVPAFTRALEERRVI